MIGTYVLSAGFYDAYYNRARKVRTLIKRDFETVFADGVDAILTPATPSAAFGLGEMANADPVQMYLNDVFTVTVNLAGLPGVSVPAGLDSAGLPLGLQLIGRPWEEGDLLNTAHVLEQAAGFCGQTREMVVISRKLSSFESFPMRVSIALAALVLVSACTSSAPYSNVIDTAGGGVGFSDYAQYMRAQEELSRIRRAEATTARGQSRPFSQAAPTGFQPQGSETAQSQVPPQSALGQPVATNGVATSDRGTTAPGPEFRDRAGGCRGPDPGSGPTRGQHPKLRGAALRHADPEPGCSPRFRPSGARDGGRGAGRQRAEPVCLRALDTACCWRCALYPSPPTALAALGSGLCAIPASGIWRRKRSLPQADLKKTPNIWTRMVMAMPAGGTRHRSGKLRQP